MRSRCLLGLVLLYLAAAPALAQQSTTNGGTPSGFATKPAGPQGPDSFTANPPSPPPRGPDSFTSNPKPKKPDSTDPKPVEPTPRKPDTAVPDQPTASGGDKTPSRSSSEDIAADSTAPSDTPDPSPDPQSQKNQASLVRTLDQGSAFEPLQATATSAATDDETEFEPGQVLVQTSDVAQARAIQNALAAEGYRVRGRRIHRSLGFVVMTLRTPADKPVAMALAELGARFPDTVVEANHVYRPLAAENQRQYGHRMIGWDVDADCGEHIRIGMIDTPVNRMHPTFQSARIHTDSVLPAGAVAAHPDHGTAVAAMLVGNGGDDIHGLLPGAELLAVNAFRGSGKKMETNVTLLLAALDRLLGDAVHVLNLSFGGPPNRLLGTALDRFIEQGIAVIAAAGNNRRQSKVYPAGYDDVIAVTALDARRKALRNASRGNYIDFAAPGVDVWSAQADGGGRYYSGTSFATPYVTAIMALARQDTGNNNDALKQLHESVMDLGESGYDPVFGHGLARWNQNCPN